MAEVANKEKRVKNILKNRSLDYERYGRYLVQDFDYKTIILRLIGELGDMVIMLLPILLWLDLFLLAASGVIAINVLYSAMFVTLILILIFTVIGNTYLSIISKGQSFGKWALRMKVVSINNNESNISTLIIREVIGKTIPIILLYIFFGLLGVLGFLVVNGIVVLADYRYHRSIIDFILKTKVVMLNAKGMKPVEKESVVKQEEQVKTDNTIDLHIYSSFSHDGEYEVEDLFKKAKAIGLKTISICDHNNVKANLIAKRVAPLYEIDYVSGINIDCNYKGHHVRLLGYFIDESDQRFTAIEYENLAKEKAVSMRRIQLFETFSGLMIDQESLNQHNRFQIVSPEMIARQVLSNVKYQKEALLLPYLHGNKKDYPIQNFVKDFFAVGKPAYVATVHPSLEDMIAIVKATGGACILAHPMHSLRDHEEVIEEIIQLKIDGLEVFTPLHSVKDENYLIALVKQYHLYVSAGSEYHGDRKKEFILGKTTCPKDAEVVIQNFIDKYKARKA